MKLAAVQGLSAETQAIQWTCTSFADRIWWLSYALDQVRVVWLMPA